MKKSAISIIFDKRVAEEYEKEGQLGEDCCEKCQAECFRASQIAPNCYHDCHCHQPSEEKKDWEEEFDLEFPYTLVALNGNIDRTDKVKSFIREKLKEEREALKAELIEEIADIRSRKYNDTSETFVLNEVMKIIKK